MRNEQTENQMANLVSEITLAMEDTLTNDQIKKLQNVLYMKMNDYTVEKEVTALALYDDSNIRILEIFLQTKRVEGKSENTITRYKDMLSTLLDSMNKPIKEITTWDLRTYLAIYKETRHVSDNTLDGMRRIYTSFFSWLQKEKYLSDDPSARLQKIKAEKKVKQIITEEDMERLRIACKTDRDIAMIDLFYSSGMRVGELSALNRADIDFTNKSVIVHGKGNKQRTVYFNGSTKVRLENYLSKRTDNNPALFVTLKNGSMINEPLRFSIKAIETRINVIAKSSGLEHIHPHKFRRSMATNMAKKNISVNKIAYILGHEKISTTQEYLVNNAIDVENSYRMCFG